MIPILRKDFLIICNRDAQVLTSLVISYLFKADQYLPILSFSQVDVSYSSKKIDDDPHVIQRRRSEIFRVFANNVLYSLGTCETLILIGLTDEQKSYLKFLKLFNYWEIEDINDIQSYFGGFTEDRDFIETSEENIFSNLCYALKYNKVLRINNSNPDDRYLESFQCRNDGAVIIESHDNSETVIALAYSASNNLDSFIIKNVSDVKKNEIDFMLELMHNKTSEEYLQTKEIVLGLLPSLFLDYSYNHVTFFTIGIPYPIFFNKKPSCLVRLDHNPDFFITRSFLYEHSDPTGAAVVFSPGFFAEEEETEYVIEFLNTEKFYIKDLKKEKASVFNLSLVIDHFPFDILHICSHGGDVSGTRCEVEFDDKFGNSYNIEFDEVLSIGINPFEDSHPVTTLWFFQKLNGFQWKSEELKNQNYSNEIYASITKHISRAYDEKTVIRKEKLGIVQKSNCVKCYGEHNYLAKFNNIGGNSSFPLVFNNSCYSWEEVSENFLSQGARGYIGTVGKVDNDIAIQSSDIFYSNVLKKGLMDAVFEINSNLITQDKIGQYIFWGLHFSTLQSPNEEIETTREKVKKELKNSLYSWIRKLLIGEGKRELIQANIKHIYHLIRNIK